jgi:peptidoglycan hydrolase-like protein with peptidoglycan-binding domain
MTAPFAAAKHPRAAGGLFAATAAAQTSRPTGEWAAGPIRRGTGRKGMPDARVIALQKKLNALGITDERGRPLLEDGIDGDHTTAAVKKYQKAHGLPETGVVDAKLMVAILTAKPAPRKQGAAAKMASGGRRKRQRHTTRGGGSKTPAPRQFTAQEAMAGKRGQSRQGGNAGT